MSKKTNSESNRKFLFWQQWLFYSSLIFAAYGLFLAFLGNTPLLAPYFELLARNFWNQNEIPGMVEEFKNFVLGPLGGSIAGYYILMAYIARYPLKNKERWARNAILAASLVWFFTDSTISVIYGIWFQAAVINVFSLVIKLLPLFFTWNEFSDKPEKQP